MSAHELDARRMLCPMPVIRTQQKVEQLQPGETLIVTCTDPGCLYDIPAWCRVHGHEIQDMQQQEDEIIISIRVGGE